ncbi:MAG: phosphatidate cytidylyltransferase [Planctomycetaceae bacterium]
MTESSPARPQKSPLLWRLALSAVIIPGLIGLFVLDHRLGARAPVLLVLAVLLAAWAAWELCGLLSVRNIAPHAPSAIAGCVTVVAAGWYLPLSTGDATFPCGLTLAPILPAYAFSVLGLFLVAAFRFREPGGSMESLSANVLTVSFVGLLLAMTAQLRWVAGADAGYLVLGSMIVAVKSGDIGAYTLGRLFGMRKMAPRLSPGKTWMGALGAVLASGLAGWAWLQFATPWFNADWSPPAWYLSVLYGSVLGVAGVLGDLCESLIKRDVGKKDSAALMPGFGGLLDLLDSVLFAGPVAWLMWTFLPLPTWA